MTHTETYQPPVGGRRSSPKFRETIAIAEEFSGLPEGVTQFDLLKLVKRAGREIGFTPKMIALLEYYILFTREQDWQDGARPIVYQSVYKTALDFTVGERAIQKLEQQLFDIGAITWNDSGNHKRFGKRSESGDILFAYGVDLSPLAELRTLLQRKYDEKQLRDAAWMETKRQISFYRARIRAYLGEICEDHPDEMLAAHARYEEIAYSIRAYMSLEDLRSLLGKHESLYNDVQALVESLAGSIKSCELSQESTSKDAKKDSHIYSTTNPLSDKSDTSSHSDIGFQESVAEPSGVNGEDRACGTDQETEDFNNDLARITVKQVLNATSSRFKERIPMHPRGLNHNDLVEAAYAILPELGIHKSAWAEACLVLGRFGAAVCVAIIDQKAQMPENRVRNPGGYLREMTARARKGELNLHRSIFGLLKRGEESHDA